MKECSNCGEEFKTGKGFPENNFECCCSLKCFVEFIDSEEIN